MVRSGWMGDSMGSPERPGQNPNVLQSFSLEPNKGTVFDTTRYGDARDTVFEPSARTVPTERPVKPEVSPEKLSLLGRLAIVLGSVAIAGGVGLPIQRHIEAQEELSLPGIGRDIGAIPQTAVKDYHFALQKLGLEIVVSPIFDKKATQGVIGPANSVLVTAQEYEKVAPPVIEKDNVNLLFPIKSKDGKAPTVEYKLTFNPFFGGTRTIRRGGEVQEKIEVNDAIILSGLKQGDILVSPITGKIYHSRAGIDLNNPNGGEWGFVIKGADEYGNEIFINIHAGALKPLITTPRLEDYKNSAELTAVDIKMGDPIGEILTLSNHRLFEGQVRVTAGSVVIEQDGTRRGGGANINTATNSVKKAFVLQ